MNTDVRQKSAVRFGRVLPGNTGKIGDSRSERSGGEHAEVLSEYVLQVEKFCNSFTNMSRVRVSVTVNCGHLHFMIRGLFYNLRNLVATLHESHT
jgi:hypothetical protein